jgi:hypothetical protein
MNRYLKLCYSKSLIHLNDLHELKFIIHHTMPNFQFHHTFMFN